MGTMSGRPVLDSLNLVVADMEATVAFYRCLGVEIPDEAIWKNHHVSVDMPGGIDLDFDSTELASHYNEGWSGDAAGRTAALIGFRVATREAVDETYDRLTKAGYRGLQPAYDTFWGARYAIVEDPSGNPVGIMSPADPERRSAPPDLA
jgi:uncharacterized glyoxalase superfamily protein PhnB